MARKKKKKKKRASPDEAPSEKPKGKGGRPSWKVTPQIIKKAAEFAAKGLIKEDIAWNLGVVPSTLYLYLTKMPELSEAIEGGKAKARAEIKGIIFEEAKKRQPWAVQIWSRRNDPAPTQVTLSGDPDKPINFAGTVHVPIGTDKAGDALAILEKARQAKLRNKKGRKSKAN